MKNTFCMKRMNGSWYIKVTAGWLFIGLSLHEALMSASSAGLI